MEKPRPPLTTERIAELMAKGHLDLANRQWFGDIQAEERSRVYTFRARAARRAYTAEQRRLKKGGA
jgi:hypothetical protein